MVDLSTLSFPKTVAVLGLGVSGLAVSDALAAAGIDFHVWVDDAATREKFAGKYVFKDFTHDLSSYDTLIPSAGIKPTHPAIVKAHQQNVKIRSDIDLLLLAAPNARVIGITGTNGKSTTTALVWHILKESGVHVEMGGNIGIAACSLPTLGADGVYVLELSSYQLSITDAPIADIAVLLNVTPDHLDWHPNLHDYIESKKKIIRQRSNRPPQTLIMGIDTEPTQNLRPKDHRIITISQIDEADVQVKDGVLHSHQNTYDLKSHAFLKGQHNFENMAAAFTVCLEMNVPPATIIKHMFTFQGLPHRQKKMRQIGHVTFINDSKATNADATSRALASFDNIYWIAGGRPKEDGIDGLEKFYPKIRHVFLIGEAESAFAKKLDGHLTYTKCRTLEHALKAAAEMAAADKNPSTVLLSPACASFDQFKNFEERGNLFATLVDGLAP